LPFVLDDDVRHLPLRVAGLISTGKHVDSPTGFDGLLGGPAINGPAHE
jgi:hypothetical protein